MKIRAILVLSVILTLSGCTKKARLYNLTTGEVSIAQYSYSGSGKGKINIALASGENLNGEYVTVAGGDVAWGSIYGSVYGPQGSASGSGVAYAASIETKQHGSAIATGDQGTIIQCEYITSAWNGAGSGACKDNHGTLYRLMF